ncbi:hypothetical protein ACHAXT_000132 [Thalassiosira profunda]
MRPSPPPAARGRDGRGGGNVRLNYRAVVALLAACLALTSLSTLALHRRLHRHHHDVAAGRAGAGGRMDAGRPRSVARTAGNRRGDVRGQSSRINADIASSNHGGMNRGTGRGNIKSSEGLSACLLVNDENPRLPEWLAYHFHLLPLRSLIVAVDPASRSSPLPILERWREVMGLDYKVWEEKEYLPKFDGHGRIRHGACDRGDPKADCLWSHRKRQRYFVKKCMADFHLRNKTWVLLTDVDEYITFNRVQDDDPAMPLEYAPPGIPTLMDWKRIEYKLYNATTKEPFMDVSVEGTISGLPEAGWKGYKNGDRKKTSSLRTEEDYFRGAHGVVHGNVVEDKYGAYFLRDDWAFRDAAQMAKAPGGVPTLKDAHVNGTKLHATIYGDRWKKDGEPVEIETNWREPPEGADMRTLYGGHLVNSADRQLTFYVERERGLWPPSLSSEQLLDIRKRLPSIGEGGQPSIQDVLESEMRRFGDYATETIGPCLSMPRLLYGSREEKDDRRLAQLAPEGFAAKDFVTLRYRWHAAKEAHANKFQKAIVDVSRLKMDQFRGEAENIHVPLKYYCRKDPPRYSASPFRVNHYLDSFEAYSYRNDARADKRQCKECYDEKGKDAAAAMDEDIAPWLKSFVGSVGREKAKQLLAGAGEFAPLR